LFDLLRSTTRMPIYAFIHVLGTLEVIVNLTICIHLIELCPEFAKNTFYNFTRISACTGPYLFQELLSERERERDVTHKYFSTKLISTNVTKPYNEC
jgi:hypothetical protein